MDDYKEAGQMADASDFWYQLITKILNTTILENQYENKDGFSLVKKYDDNKIAYEGNVTIPLETAYVELTQKNVILLALGYIKAPEWIAFQVKPDDYRLTDDHFIFDEKKYMLCGIIHYVSQCHYYSDIKFEGSWWRLNDNRDPIKYSSFDEVDQSTLYMLVYTSNVEAMTRNHIFWSVSDLNF